MSTLSVKARITIWFTLLMLLITAASLGFVIMAGGSLMENYSLNRLVEMVNENAEEITYGEEGLEVGAGFEAYSGGGYTLVYSEDGTLLRGRAAPGFNPWEPLSAGEPYLVACPGGDFYIYDRRLPDGLWLRGVLPADGVGGFPLVAARLAFFILPMLVLLAAGGGYLIARRAFSPIDRIIAAADAISGGKDLSARIGLPPLGDEIHRIASSFDNMFRRLEESFEAEKQFASDASHELRTPTAVILAQCAALKGRSFSEEEYREGLAAIERQAQKMSLLVNQLLNITRLEQGGARISFERADLSELTEIICRETALIKNGVELRLDIEKDICAEIDVFLMSRLIENLLENGCKYGSGLLEVSLRRDGRRIRLSVRDNGAGIAPEELPKIWRRFYRADKSRGEGGLGLGLSFVKQIAGLHNAVVTAESKEGEGSVFTLELEAAED
ncbi:MAG: HAMP domain-containing sensor histidine kinase [Synergistaceae bacterium]|nr:HAMP domain-containing sensor histidine kinase [Synergistaceae bacterium]